MPCSTMNDVIDEMKNIKFLLRYRNVRLEACLDPMELLQFERTYTLRLPGEYRLFILEVGNGLRGDMGPCQEGILAFGETPIGYPLDFPTLAESLLYPFPYHEQVLFDKTCTSRHEEDLGGYIPLGTCFNSNGSYWILVCEGTRRGDVWIINWSVGAFPCLSFKEWLKDWVENDGQTLYQIFRGLPLTTTNGITEPSFSMENHFTRQRRGAIEIRDRSRHLNIVTNQ